MDKNTLAGFGLLMLLLIGYIFYNQPSDADIRQQKIADSIAAVKSKVTPATPQDSIKVLQSANTVIDSTSIIPEKDITLENDKLKITFTNKGGFPKKVELKTFKTFDGKPLLLLNGTENSYDFSFLNTQGSKIHSKAQVFADIVAADGKSVQFNSHDMQINYSLPTSGYMVEMSVLPTGVNNTQPISLDWHSLSLLTEQDLSSQQQYTQVCYNLEGEGYDYFTIKTKESKTLKQPIKWLSFKQHYFNTTLIPTTNFIESGSTTTEIKVDTAKKTLSDFASTFALKHQDKYDFQLFMGPNDYKLLKNYKKDLQEIIPLSYGIFGFVKYINLWLIIPIFNFLAKMFGNYGIVILLLTFIIRLLMSPFTYKSYVSSAKMKALKPELDELREKLGDDKQAYGVEQMKLYRQAGVNPLGGCLPALLQLPVFFALLSFFPHSIELRQSSFLWAKDLSAYDSIASWSTQIPLLSQVYGNHISLFTILFVITSLVLALYSMNMATQDQNNPMMKYLPFIMPLMFLGIFNKLPAALTYYYFVSNVITLGLQFVIQNYIINPDKIHAEIQAKKKEAPKENKLMARMAEMQKQQQERNKKK